MMSFLILSVFCKEHVYLISLIDNQIKKVLNKPRKTILIPPPLALCILSCYILDIFPRGQEEAEADLFEILFVSAYLCIHFLINLFAQDIVLAEAVVWRCSVKKKVFVNF